MLRNSITLPDDVDAVSAVINDMHPLRRPDRDEEIADAVAFLASPAASLITGKVLAVDSGLMARLDGSPRKKWRVGLPPRVMSDHAALPRLRTARTEHQRLASGKPSASARAPPRCEGFVPFGHALGAGRSSRP